MKTQNITYKGKQIRLNVKGKIREGICALPGCSVKKGHTELHHWAYKYTLKQVRANPLLALDFTTEFCYTCHRLANALRQVLDTTEYKIDIFKKLRIIAWQDTVIKKLEAIEEKASASTAVLKPATQ